MENEDSKLLLSIHKNYYYYVYTLFYENGFLALPYNFTCK